MNTITNHGFFALPLDAIGELLGRLDLNTQSAFASASKALNHITKCWWGERFIAQIAESLSHKREIQTSLYGIMSSTRNLPISEEVTNYFNSINGPILNTLSKLNPDEIGLLKSITTIKFFDIFQKAIDKSCLRTLRQKGVLTRLDKANFGCHEDSLIHYYVSQNQMDLAKEIVDQIQDESRKNWYLNRFSCQ